MASAAEQLAANLNLGVLSKATELKKRIWFTLGALIVYRIGTYVPVPGVDAAVMGEMLRQHGGGILGMFDMFTGGALGRMTVFALNIMPYISASIIIQLMSAAVPTLEALKKEGEAGRKKLNQYTRYLTVLIAMFQSYGIAVGLESMRGSFGAAVIDPGLFFRLSCVITLVGGTMFLMWLGEQITARGVGNGISLIIFAGIVANLPHCAGLDCSNSAAPARCRPFFIIFFLVLRRAGDRLRRVRRAGAATHRRAIPEAPGRQPHVRRRVHAHAAEAEHLRRDPADLRLLHPADPGDRRRLRGRARNRRLAAMDRQRAGARPAAVHGALRGDDHLLRLFYTAVVFNPQETADNLKKYGGFVPGIRPGQRHRRLLRPRADPADRRSAALYLVAVCLLPEILISDYGLPFYFGGTSILIIVSVTMDTVTQIQSHLLAHQYEGLIRKARVRGRR